MMDDDFHVLEFGNINIILGIQWVMTIGKYTQDFRTTTFKFKVDYKKIILKGIYDESPQGI